MIKVKSRGNESVEQMLKRFKKMCEKEGLTKDIKRNSYYEKPSERRRRDEEGRGDRGRRRNEEEHRERHARERGIEKKQGRCHGREACDTGERWRRQRRPYS